MNSKILAIETSTEFGSVAIVDNQEILYRLMDTDQKPSLSVLTSIETLLAEAGLNKRQLDAVSFGRGPGSFTGVRLATSVAQMIAFGLDVPVISVSTLRALAQQGWHKYQYDRILPALDARLNQVYWGCYQYDPSMHLVSLVSEEKLEHFNQAKWPINSSMPWYGIGDGWDHYAKDATVKWIVNAYPTAYDVATIAQVEYQRKNFIEASAVEPYYIRNQLVTIPT